MNLKNVEDIVDDKGLSGKKGMDEKGNSYIVRRYSSFGTPTLEQQIRYDHKKGIKSRNKIRYE